MGERSCSYRIWWGKLRERDHTECPGIDGRITLQWIFKKWVGDGWTGLAWLSICTAGWIL
jgi:hypothetical protein